MFGLSPNPDFRSYAPDVPWGLVFLDGRGLRYFNENPLSYEGVTDEASLVAAIESALPARVTTPRNIRWNPLAGEGQWDGAVGRQSIWDSRGNSTMTVYYPPLDA